ncbi:RHS repeat-associated core domain-containing protein [Nostoc sp.]|uniref:RHS repeat-associated core domain-containing protein n=1 Tax=Nostoc sp. TaxID=1180 RepID=UPI0035930C7E
MSYLLYIPIRQLGATTYEYDAASNRTSVTTASGTVNYTFDVRNRLDQVLEGGIVTADYDYDAVSNLVRTTLANGTQEIRSYDDLNRLKYLENHKGDTILSSYTCTLDKVGNRTKVVEHNGRSVDYTYDDLYRLAQEKITDAINGNRVYGYTYDKVGNRKTKSETVNGATTVTDYAYDANDRLLNETVNQQAVTNYTYDNNGNTLTKTENSIITEYTWNYENRLIAAIVKDTNGAIQQAMQYRYNDNGIRVAATIDGVETRYLIDEMQPYAQVLEEYSLNGAVQVKYVYGNDLIAQEQENSRTFYHVDGLSSTRVLTDATGNLVSTYDYEAFGELLNSSGGTENKYLFAGEQFDEALGDYYNRARYYDADTGRFIRKDDYEGQISDPLTLHKYIYANSNPVSFIDPSGYNSLLQITATLAIISILAEALNPFNLLGVDFLSNDPFSGFDPTRGLGGQIDFDPAFRFIQEVIFHRAANQVSKTRNVAVAEYIDKAGIRRYITAENIPKSVAGVDTHAEKELAGKLQQLRIPFSKVTKIYTEFEPCNTKNNQCATFLKFAFPKAQVYYSYPYKGGMNNSSRLRKYQDLGKNGVDFK